MPKTDLRYLGDMLDFSRRAIALSSGMTRPEFEANDAVLWACIHFIQVVGEGAFKTSAEFCQVHPEIPWEKIRATRHRIVHDYSNVDLDVIWDVIQQHLPALVPQLEQLIPTEPE